MKALHLGSFVHPVTIQTLTEGADASGAPAESWATLTTAWMARQVVHGGRGESFAADQLSGAIVTQWTMRYAADMDPDRVNVVKDRRLLYLGRVYDIVQAELLDRQTGILLRTLAASAVTA